MHRLKPEARGGNNKEGGKSLGVGGKNKWTFAKLDSAINEYIVFGIRLSTMTAC